MLPPGEFIMMTGYSPFPETNFDIFIHTISVNTNGRNNNEGTNINENNNRDNNENNNNIRNAIIFNSPANSPTKCLAIVSENLPSKVQKYSKKFWSLYIKFYKKTTSVL